MEAKTPCRLYGLVDPFTPHLYRYVGRTTFKARFEQHLRDAIVNRAPWPVSAWIRDLSKDGRCPMEVPLDEFEDEHVAIVTLRERGHPLLNATDGGERGPLKELPDHLVAKLGTVPDSAIAADPVCPLSRRSVQRRREMLGVPPFKGRSAIDWAILDGLLGTMPDAELAEQTGVSASAIGDRRRKLGIASFREARRSKRRAGDRPPSPGRTGGDRADDDAPA